MKTAREKIKPIDGQRHLFGGCVVKYCSRCRRLLTDGKSIERGLGPTCFRRECDDVSKKG